MYVINVILVDFCLLQYMLSYGIMPFYVCLKYDDNVGDDVVMIDKTNINFRFSFLFFFLLYRTLFTDRR